MQKKGIDYNTILDENVPMAYAAGAQYDKEELRIFKVILIISALLPLLVAIFRTFAN